jgi:hypothetical protein
MNQASLAARPNIAPDFQLHRQLNKVHMINQSVEEDINLYFYILSTVHLDVILVNDQLDALFFNVFISCLYMFRATSAHHQEGQLVLIHNLV